MPSAFTPITPTSCFRRGAQLIPEELRNTVGHLIVTFTVCYRGYTSGQITVELIGKRDLYLPGTSFRSHYGSEWQVPSAYNNDYWTEENTGAYFPRARFNGGSAINQAQTRYMVDASYCRLKSVSIGYTLPKVLTQKASIQFRIESVGGI